MKAWTTEDATKQRDEARGAGPGRAARRRRRSATSSPVPLGVTVSTAPHQRGAPPAHRERAGPAARAATRRWRKEVVLYSAHHDHLGRKDDAQARRGRHLQRRPRQRGRRRRDAVRGPRLHRAARRRRAAPSSSPRWPPRSTGLLGSAVPRGASARALRAASPRTSTSTASTSGAARATSPSSAWASPAWTPSSPRLAKAQGRTVKADQLSDRGFFYRSDQFNFAQAGHPRRLLRQRHGLHRQARGLGQGAARAVGGEALPPALRRAPPGVGPVRRRRGHPAASSSWAPGGEGAPRMPAWNKGDEFEAARLKSLEALKAPARE